MTIEFVESVRFLCPVCQRDWTGERGSPCEECYAVGWNAAMVEACKGDEHPWRAPPGSACAMEDCPNPAPRSGDYCSDCEWKIQRMYDRNDRLRDAEVNRRIDERRGK